MHYIYLLVCFFSAGLLMAMDQPQVAQKLSTNMLALQREPALERETVGAHCSPQKSLYEHFGISNAEMLSKDLSVMVACLVLKKSEWWYKKTEFSPGDWVNDVAFHPTKKLLATASNNGVACLWDFEGNCNFILEYKKEGKYNKRVYGVALHPTEPLLATALDDGTAELLNYEEKKIVILNHATRVNKVVLHPTEPLLATACDEGTAYVWNYQDHKKCIIKHQGNLEGIALHPTEKLLATASAHGTVCVCDYEGTNKLTLKEHLSNKYNGVALHRDKLIATASYDGMACLWDYQRNKKLTLRHGKSVNAVALHPTETILATASDDHTACLWDYHGNKKVTLLHDCMVKAIALHPTEELVATGSYPGVILWQKIRPTLPQLLFRQLLKDYFLECIVRRKAIELCEAADELPVWMSKTFAIQQEELENVWASMPEALRQSIFYTLCFRAEEIARIQQKSIDLSAE